MSLTHLVSFSGPDELPMRSLYGGCLRMHGRTRTVIIDFYMRCCTVANWKTALALYTARIYK
jgi:hypothetical protein